MIPDILTREASFDAVEKVFAAMAAGEARNFPVVREAIGHEDALYGFKGGFDAVGGVLGLKAGGYWPHNLDRRGIINHQSTVFLFDPDTGRVKALVGGNYLTALRTAAASSVSIRHLARKDAKVLGMIGAGHQAKFQLRAAAETHAFEKVIGWNLHPEMLPGLAEVAREVGLPFEAVELPGNVRGGRDHHHHLEFRADASGGPCQPRHPSGLHGHRHERQAGGRGGASGPRPRLLRRGRAVGSRSARPSMRWPRGFCPRVTSRNWAP